DASLATWLSRIVINEALGRLRKKKRIVAMPENPKARIIRFPLNPSDLNSSDLNPGDDPERTMAQRQILALVERATDSLPDVYRTVFVARVIEGL
ncbi:RNA polymerase sigma factor, partial [Mesorhizobium sp. M3A.F.Ca.ET.201.01.1.1]